MWAWLNRLRLMAVDQRAYSFACGTSTVNANTTAIVTYTVTGIKVDDVALSVQPAMGGLPTGVGIVGWEVSAANTLKVRFMNTTAGNLALVDSTFKVVVARY
jgi:hypothetical protein